jgi:acyl-CoA thioesterase-1
MSGRLASIVPSIVLTILLLPFLAVASPGPVVLIVGDSLSAGYGMKVSESWPALLQSRLESSGYGHQVVNASISGETTRGGLTRLPAALDRHTPDVVIVELGGNDGLRGIPLNEIRRNLEQMLDKSRSAGARVLLAGVYIPPNYGPAYTTGFREIFEDLGSADDVALVPFILDGVALDPDLMQADGIHPNAAGQPKILENVWPTLVSLLGEP